jgi:hypothetical protein
LSRKEIGMSVVIANGLLTGQYLSAVQLECAYRHYQTLANHLTDSGPRFSDARLEAVRMGNLALGKLRAERERAEREAAEVEHGDGFEVVT